MLKKLSLLMASGISLVLVLLLFGVSCKAKSPGLITQPFGVSSTTATGIVPYIPPAYYQCISVLPIDLENAFYLEYNNTSLADAAYDGQVFVFKDLLVDAYMIRDVDKGWLWADLIKCPIDDINTAKNLQAGNTVDIVGTCVGRDTSQSKGLLFGDCYVLPTGSIQLPAPGGTATFTPGY